MSDTPTFSVIIPCYNAAQTLPQALESVAAQTCGDYEIIVVDDGSTDDVSAVLQAAAASEPRLRATRQANAGVSAARNTACAAARGQIFAFLDADDVWAPDKLARHKAQFDADPTLSVAYGQIRFLNPDGTPTAVTSNRPVNTLTIRDLLAENVACTASTLLVRREAFARAGPFNPDLAFDEDKEWLLRAFVAGEKIRGLNLPLTGYRTSPGGLAGDLERARVEWGRYAALARELAPAAVDQARPGAEAIFLRNLARRALRLGAPPKQALTLMRDAVAADWRALLVEPRRSLMTAAAALTAAALPRGWSGRFARLLDRAPSKLSDLKESVR